MDLMKHTTEWTATFSSPGYLSLGDGHLKADCEWTWTYEPPTRSRNAAKNQRYLGSKLAASEVVITSTKDN